MAVGNTLERTRQTDLQPLVVKGVPVYRTFGQIRIELQRALSREHVELFADPNSDPATGDIVWYATFPGEVRKLADCSEDDRAKLEFNLSRLVDDISVHTETLSRIGTEEARAMAHILDMALEIPDESHIFIVANRPVLAGWGHLPRGPAAPIKLLSTLAKRRLVAQQPVPPAPEPVVATPQSDPEPAPPPAVTPLVSEETVSAAIPEKPPLTDDVRLQAGIGIEAGTVLVRRLRWLNPLLWSILAVLLLCIGDFLLRYCGLGWPFSVRDSLPIINYCEVPSAAAMATGRNSELLAELNSLQRDLEAKRNRCSTAQDATTKRVEEGGGRIGALNVILTWNTKDDLDIHVTCPSGEEIYYREKQHCGGKLDVDQNSGSGQTDSPVENVTWPTGAAPSGTYKVDVDPFDLRVSEQQPVEFTVELRIDGAKVEEYRRSVSKSQGKTHVFDFTMPYVPHRQ